MHLWQQICSKNEGMPRSGGVLGGCVAVALRKGGSRCKLGPDKWADETELGDNKEKCPVTALGSGCSDPHKKSDLHWGTRAPS